jgi:CDGSH-type Zn-finger protein
MSNRKIISVTEFITKNGKKCTMTEGEYKYSSDMLVCECGSNVTRGSMYKHKTSKSHKFNLFSKEEQQKIIDKKLKSKEETKQKLPLYQKEYSKMRLKQSIECECGSSVSKPHIAKHKVSIKHLEFIENKVLKEKSQEIIFCECGEEVKRCSIVKHKESRKHNMKIAQKSLK